MRLVQYLPPTDPRERYQNAVPAAARSVRHLYSIPSSAPCSRSKQGTNDMYVLHHTREGKGKKRKEKKRKKKTKKKKQKKTKKKKCGVRHREQVRKGYVGRYR